MHLEVTFRHMNPRPEIKKRADALFEKLHRFLDPAADAQLIVGAEHGAAAVELVVSSRGTVAKAEEEDEDLRTALDRAFHRVEDQLRRGKEKGVDRRRRASPTSELAPGEEPLVDEEDDLEEEEA
jgi:ribosomal subunit interface protein